jgi:hypothetical protein
MGKIIQVFGGMTLDQHFLQADNCPGALVAGVVWVNLKLD